MKLHEDKLEVLMGAFEWIKWNDDSRAFSIYKISGRGEKKLVYGINWSACGTKSVEETVKFATNLQKTAVIVDLINNLEIEVVRSEGSCFSSKEEYTEAKKQVIEMIKNFETGKLIAWLLA